MEKVHHKQSKESRIKQERNKSKHQTSNTFRKKNIKTTRNRLKNMSQQETAKTQKTQPTQRVKLLRLALLDIINWISEHTSHGIHIAVETYCKYTEMIAFETSKAPIRILTSFTRNTQGRGTKLWVTPSKIYLLLFLSLCFLTTVEARTGLNPADKTLNFNHDNTFVGHNLPIIPTDAVRIISINVNGGLTTSWQALLGKHRFATAHKFTDCMKYKQDLRPALMCFTRDWRNKRPLQHHLSKIIEGLR